MTGRRLLYVVNDDRFFISHRLPLARGAAAAGYTVGVAAPPGSSEAAIREAGFDFFPVRFKRGSLNLLGELIPLRDLGRAHRAFRPHLVHHITFKPIVLGSWVARRQGVPVVNTLTGLGYVFMDDGLKRRILRTIAEAGYRIALRGPRMRTIFQNPDDERLFAARGLLPREDARIVRGSGVDPERFRPCPEPGPEVGPPVVLFAARMLWDKGLGELIEAARALRREGVAFRLLLAGSPDRSNPACVPEAQLRAWQTDGLAEWLGHHTDLPALLARTHIVCLPSYREGLPLSLIEAAAAGRPIVTTDVPGCREIVEDGVNGLRVPVGNAPALAAALRQLIGDAALRKAMGEAGRRLVLEHFTTRRVVEQTLAVYAELAGTPRVGSAMTGSLAP
jgi:glycosyltransferase involved in cell wall biosynthesis